MDLTTPYEGTLTLVVDREVFTEMILVVLELPSAVAEEDFRAELDRMKQERLPGAMDAARERGDFAYPEQEIGIEVEGSEGRIVASARLTPGEDGQYLAQSWAGAEAGLPSRSETRRGPTCPLTFPAGAVTIHLRGSSYADLDLTFDANEFTGDALFMERLAFLRRR